MSFFSDNSEVEKISINNSFLLREVNNINKNKKKPVVKEILIDNNQVELSVFISIVIIQIPLHIRTVSLTH